MIAIFAAVHIVLQIATGAIGGPLPEGSAAVHTVEWIRADATHGAAPRCFLAESRAWGCWRAGIDHTGVIVLHDAGSIWWQLPDRQTTRFRSARWGRLLVVSAGASVLSGLRVTFARPVAPPPARGRAIRLDTAPIADARAIAIAPNAVWVAGAAIPPKAWVEIAADGAAPVYLALEAVAAAPVSVPLHVALTEGRPLDGRIIGQLAEPARGALVTVFRLIDPPPADGSRALPRRVLIGETTADEEGRFALPALGEGDYELVAWHAQLGRASVPVTAAASALTIRLRASGLVRGRVLAGGQPVEGVDVISVPDAGGFGAAEDMIDVKGGDARSGADGRFTVMAAPKGGGELRIGGGVHPVKRVPLPRVPVPIFDAGDVDLGHAIAIVVVLDRDTDCGLRAAGPVGRTGLQLVSGTRSGNGIFEVLIPEPGLWEFTLLCTRDPSSLHPSVVQIDAAKPGREVRMIVR